jgi:hypothetical protein
MTKKNSTSLTAKKSAALTKKPAPAKKRAATSGTFIADSMVPQSTIALTRPAPGKRIVPKPPKKTS